MDQLHTTKLTVAKLCHEVANHLSVLVFLKEDLVNKTQELSELFTLIDMLTHTMDFFRNIYATSGTISNIMETMQCIAKLKSIHISDDSNVMKKSDDNSGAPSFLGGVLYIVLKACKPNDTISITKSPKEISITVSSPRRLHEAVSAAFNEETCKEDIFNTFALYVKKLAKFQGFNVSADTDESGGLRIKAWTA
ncbi:MAG: hypothetical protein LBJ69_02085 [Holosporales bacterium]|jgi:hypothetical protein|nr:hypothetical protein [Holosporales bacterium]